MDLNGDDKFSQTFEKFSVAKLIKLFLFRMRNIEITCILSFFLSKSHHQLQKSRKIQPILIRSNAIRGVCHSKKPPNTLHLMVCAYFLCHIFSISIVKEPQDARNPQNAFKGAHHHCSSPLTYTVQEVSSKRCNLRQKKIQSIKFRQYLFN